MRRLLRAIWMVYLGDQSKIRDQLFYLAEKICRFIESGKSGLLQNVNWIGGCLFLTGLGMYCSCHGQMEIAFVPFLNLVLVVIIYITIMRAQLLECLSNFIFIVTGFHSRRHKMDKNRPAR